MKKILGLAVVGLFVGACAAVQRHEIVVRFEDLRQDLFMMELAVENKQWAQFDWSSMTVTISALRDESRAQGRGGSPDMRSIRPTPEINAIMARRQSRSDTCAALRRAGKVGEGREGLLLRVPDGPAMTEEEAKDLAEENADRRALFAEFKKQFDSAEQSATLAEIAHTFAQARRDPRIQKPGEWFQNDAGEWKRVVVEER